MEKKLFVVLAITLFLISQIIADTKTKIFQNGLNEYKGCEDTYIAYQLFDDLTATDKALNHEGKGEIEVKSCVS